MRPLLPQLHIVITVIIQSKVGELIQQAAEIVVIVLQIRMLHSKVILNLESTATFSLSKVVPSCLLIVLVAAKAHVVVQILLEVDLLVLSRTLASATATATP